MQRILSPFLVNLKPLKFTISRVLSCARSMPRLLSSPLPDQILLRNRSQCEKTETIGLISTCCNKGTSLLYCNEPASREPRTACSCASCAVAIAECPSNCEYIIIVPYSCSFRCHYNTQNDEWKGNHDTCCMCIRGCRSPVKNKVCLAWTHSDN